MIDTIRKFKSQVCTAAIIPMLLQPSMAAAHLVTTGMGPVYDGIGHLLLTPEDLVPALAIAVYSGMRGKATGRRALFLLPLAWLLGGVAGLYSGSPAVNMLPAFSYIILGVLIASDMYLSLRLFTLLVFAVGLVHGFFNGAAIKVGPGFYGLLGISTFLFVLMTLLSAFILALKRPWNRIVVRVSGSWVAAVGILMIGWYIRGQS